ncbi:addiction module HigA family antidote [Stella humosa]|uniref:Addiction module HigA family antidote n=1 Tax=Stella humosa TaxID=94 RepID=A0A3N1L3J0_9PROT|nr:HigA family addiction module antitoxin [Stella humosa]ROP83975.1 addiction module HigA family antidote [Stella humosa]BBK33483.1 hypothetical protein STHU_41170 [Stella humosa]
MNDTPLKIAMRPPHPGVFLREEVLEVLELSIDSAAAKLGVEHSELVDLLNGAASLSNEMARRVEKVFGLNMETMLRMQAWHDRCSMAAT